MRSGTSYLSQMICPGHMDHLHFFIIIHIFVFLIKTRLFEDAFPGVSVNRDFFVLSDPYNCWNCGYVDYDKLVGCIVIVKSFSTVPTLKICSYKPVKASGTYDLHLKL